MLKYGHLKSIGNVTIYKKLALRLITSVMLFAISINTLANETITFTALYYSCRTILRIESNMMDKFGEHLNLFCKVFNNGPLVLDKKKQLRHFIIPHIQIKSHGSPLDVTRLDLWFRLKEIDRAISSICGAIKLMVSEEPNIMRTTFVNVLEHGWEFEIWCHDNQNILLDFPEAETAARELILLSVQYIEQHVLLLAKLIDASMAYNDDEQNPKKISQEVIHDLQSTLQMVQKLYGELNVIAGRHNTMISKVRYGRLQSLFDQDSEMAAIFNAAEVMPAVEIVDLTVGPKIAAIIRGNPPISNIIEILQQYSFCGINSEKVQQIKNQIYFHNLHPELREIVSRVKAEIHVDHPSWWTSVTAIGYQSTTDKVIADINAAYLVRDFYRLEGLLTSLGFDADQLQYVMSNIRLRINNPDLFNEVFRFGDLLGLERFWLSGLSFGNRFVTEQAKTLAWQETYKHVRLGIVPQSLAERRQIELKSAQYFAKFHVVIRELIRGVKPIIYVSPYVSLDGVITEINAAYQRQDLNDIVAYLKKLGFNAEELDRIIPAIAKTFLPSPAIL